VGWFAIDIEIDRAPSVVFAFVSDMRRMPLWYEAVDQVDSLTPGAPAVGARYEIWRTLPGGRVRNEIAITEYEPDVRITVESVAGPTPFRYRYALESESAHTRVLLDGRITGEGLPGPLAHLGPLTTQLFKRGMGDNLRRLKGLIESS
jgi:uncharacterized membrane protein